MTRPRLTTIKSRLANNMAPSRARTVEPGSWRAFAKGAHGRGYDAAWTKLRHAHLLANPHCVYCLVRLGLTDKSPVDVELWCAANRVPVPLATIGDHIVPHQGRDSLRLDPDNVQSLCKPCHDGQKAREERAAGYRR